MQRNARLQMVGVLLVGALLGYLAASGKLNPFASARTPPQPPQEKTTRTAETGSAEKPAGCQQWDLSAAPGSDPGAAG
jgi:hypothetical protein